MVTVGTRLRIIRKDAGLSQVELGKLAGSNQSAINRYETDRAAVPYRMLIWYAQYFDVSMDYIFGLCDDKRGRIVNCFTRRHGRICTAQTGLERVRGSLFRAGK